jgi:hypothetical protein
MAWRLRACGSMNRSSWLTMLAIVGFAAPAGAQDVGVVSPELAIPANGSVLVHSGGGRPTIQVTPEGSSTTVTGTLRQISPENLADWAWTPAVSFEPGRYSVMVLIESSDQRTDTITVSEAIELDRMPSPLQPRVERVVDMLAGTGIARCVRWDGEHLQPDYMSAFNVVESAVVVLVGGVAPDAAPELVHQYFYSTSDHAFGADMNAWTTSPPFAEQSERYCLTYRALRIGTGEEQSVELCAEHGDLPPLVGHEVEVPDSKLDRTVCQGPPVGFEQRWCTLNQSCDALRDPAEIEASHCELYGAVCRNECLPGGISIGSLTLPAGGAGVVTRSPWGAGTSGNPNAAPCVDLMNEGAAGGDEPPSGQASSGEPSSDEPPSGESSSDEPSSDAEPSSIRKRRTGCGCSLVGVADGERALLALPVWIVLASRLRRRSYACRGTS